MPRETRSRGTSGMPICRLCPRNGSAAAAFSSLATILFRRAAVSRSAGPTRQITNRLSSCPERAPKGLAASSLRFMATICRPLSPASEGRRSWRRFLLWRARRRETPPPWPSCCSRSRAGGGAGDPSGAGPRTPSISRTSVSRRSLNVMRAVPIDFVASATQRASASRIAVRTKLSTARRRARGQRIVFRRGCGRVRGDAGGAPPPGRRRARPLSSLFPSRSAGAAAGRAGRGRGAARDRGTLVARDRGGDDRPIWPR